MVASYILYLHSLQQEYKSEVKTSDQWCKIIEKRVGITIHNADGWDRSNFETDWFETKIDFSQFIERLANSTITTIGNN